MQINKVLEAKGNALKILARRFNLSIVKGLSFKLNLFAKRDDKVSPRFPILFKKRLACRVWKTHL